MISLSSELISNSTYRSQLHNKADDVRSDAKISTKGRIEEAKGGCKDSDC